ncbi:unnamed protein product [Owenia fusiformis]|uniref:Uncharacterized protein n=1 Tax=Owenia fusiformis TaxID=6347 RepID=A0A8J1XMG0_OWEFU|nr:unnamed protein product [Owenia fusiformis]
MQQNQLKHENGCARSCYYWRSFWLATMCLLPGMSKFARIGVLWGWITLIILLSSLIIRFATFGPDQTESSPGDQRIVGKVTNLMCQSVKVTNREKHAIDVYTSDGVPPILQNKTFQILTRSTNVYDNEKHVHWTFTLISGTRGVVMTTTSANVEFVIFQGRHNLNLFLGKVRRQRCNNRCFLQYHKYKEGTHRANLSVSTTEDYFFLYRRSKASAQPGINFSKINVTFILNRALYNLSNSNHACTLSTLGNSSSMCDVDLPYMTNRQVVITYDPKSDTENNIKVVTECYPRIGIYMVFFLVIPLVVGAMVSGLIMVLCKENECCGKRLTMENQQATVPTVNVPYENATHSDLFSSPEYKGTVSFEPQDYGSTMTKKY